MTDFDTDIVFDGKPHRSFGRPTPADEATEIRKALEDADKKGVKYVTIRIAINK